MKIPKVTVVLAALIAGIMIEYFMAVPPQGNLAAGGALLLTATILLWRNSRYCPPGSPGEKICNVLMWVGVAALGFILTGQGLFRPADSVIALAGREVMLTGEIVSYPDRRADRQYVILQARQAVVDGEAHSVGGRVRITVDDPDFSLAPGDHLNLQAKLKIAPGAGNPGQFSYQGYLLRQGIVLTAFARPEDMTVAAGDIDSLLGRPILLIRRLCWSLRRSLAAEWRTWLSPAAYQLAAALLFGERERLSPQQEELFVRAGVAHLLAVSGLHVGILVAAGSWLLGLLLPGSRLKKVLLAGGLIGYATFVGWSAPISRTVVMMGPVILNGGRSTARDGLAALSCAALFLLLWQPLLLFDTGFQLSFAATGAIILGLRRLKGWWERPMVRALGISTIAQLSTAPLVAYYFHRLHFISFLATLILTPLIALFMLAVAFLTIPAALFPGLTSPAGMIVAGQERLITGILRLLGSVPGANLAVPAPSLVWIGVYYLIFSWFLLGFPGLWVGKRRLLSRRALGATAVILAVCLLLAGKLQVGRAPLELVFLDVGQGDSIFVRTREGTSVLIDGGGGGNVGSKYFFDVG